MKTKQVGKSAEKYKRNVLCGVSGQLEVTLNSEASEGQWEGLRDGLKCCYLPDHEAGKDEADPEW